MTPVRGRRGPAVQFERSSRDGSNRGDLVIKASGKYARKERKLEELKLSRKEHDSSRLVLEVGIMKWMRQRERRASVG